MSIISNVTEITGVGSNGTAMETVLSNAENVFGAPFHVSLNVATGCSYLYNRYGWFYNNTPYTFTWAIPNFTGIGGWASRFRIRGAIGDEANELTCPTSNIIIFMGESGDVSNINRGFSINLPPGKKIWVGGVERKSDVGDPDGPDNWYGTQGASFNSCVIYVKKP